MRLKPRPLFLGIFSFALIGLICAQAGALPKKTDLPKTRIRIELTGGDDNQPVANASVYLRFQENARDQKGRMLELNLKTSGEGVALSPEIPQGHILIQVVAQGWKTYGEWHEINQAEQTVPVHIVRPTTKYY